MIKISLAAIIQVLVKNDICFVVGKTDADTFGEGILKIGSTGKKFQQYFTDSDRSTDVAFDRYMCGGIDSLCYYDTEKHEIIAISQSWKELIEKSINGKK